MRYLAAILLLASFVLAVPCPVNPPLDPNSCGFTYDPNAAASQIEQCLIVYTNERHVGRICACEPDGEDVVVQLVSAPAGVVVDPKPYEVVVDGTTGAVMHKFYWSWTPTDAQEGLHYVSFICVENVAGRVAPRRSGGAAAG